MAGGTHNGPARCVHGRSMRRPCRECQQKQLDKSSKTCYNDLMTNDSTPLTEAQVQTMIDRYVAQRDRGIITTAEFNEAIRRLADRVATEHNDQTTLKEG